MVTAAAATGMPARRLAIRATFIPCSASGIAQPRITSSTSEDSTPGARRSASLITVAASSSGRVPRRVPAGALPTGVRTAETITASLIWLDSYSCYWRQLGATSLKIPKQILDRVGDLADAPVEQVIGCIDHHELFRLVRPRVELADVLERADFIALAVDEELRFRARGDRPEVVAVHRDGDADQQVDTRILGPHRQRDPRAERHSSCPHR